MQVALMPFTRWTKEARLSIARLPVGLKVPESPAHIYRDPWHGDAEQGARLVNDTFAYEGRLYRVQRGNWERGPWPDPVRDWLHGFGWLRDLRALGSDDARLAARRLVADWCSHPPTDPLIRNAAVTGERIAAWLGNHEFCTASANERYQQKLMERVLVEARTIAAQLPLPVQGWRALTALRGLLAAAMAAPEYEGFMGRFQRYLEPELARSILPDGTVAERSPEAQFQTVRELSEMSAMFRTTHAPVPDAINAALDRLCPILRALRHSDGGLAVFNGSGERRAREVEAVLALGARQRVIAPAMPDGRFSRVTLGRSLLIVDAGAPAGQGFDRDAHAGTLSFEFSHHRQRLFVNCGSASVGAWKDALRGSPAHTLLVADRKSSSDFRRDGSVVRRPVRVTSSAQSNGEAHWLDFSHDGYHAPFGAKWTRRLYLGKDGEDLRGQDIVDGEREIPFVLRFHLHPDVAVTLDDEDVILRAGGQIWRFRQDLGTVTVESSVYLARGRVEQTKQIVVTAPPPAQAPAEPKPAEPKPAESTSAEPAPAESSAAEPTPPESTPPESTLAEPAPGKAAPRRRATRQAITWGLERVPE